MIFLSTDYLFGYYLLIYKIGGYSSLSTIETNSEFLSNFFELLRLIRIYLIDLN